MYRRLEALVDELAVTEAIRAVVLTGTGERAFFGRGRREGVSRRLGPRALAPPDPLHPRCLRKAGRPSPAGDRGREWPRLRGGFELTLFCDLRLASDRTRRFALSEVKLGLFPGTGGVQRLPASIGAARAKECC